MPAVNLPGVYRFQPAQGSFCINKIINKFYRLPEVCHEILSVGWLFRWTSTLALEQKSDRKIFNGLLCPNWVVTFFSPNKSCFFVGKWLDILSILLGDTPVFSTSMMGGRVLFVVKRYQTKHHPRVVLFSLLNLVGETGKAQVIRSDFFQL